MAGKGFLAIDLPLDRLGHGETSASLLPSPGSPGGIQAQAHYRLHDVPAHKDKFGAVSTCFLLQDRGRNVMSQGWPGPWAERQPEEEKAFWKGGMGMGVGGWCGWEGSTLSFVHSQGTGLPLHLGMVSPLSPSCCTTPTPPLLPVPLPNSPWRRPLGDDWRPLGRRLFCWLLAAPYLRPHHRTAQHHHQVHSTTAHAPRSTHFPPPPQKHHCCCCPLTNRDRSIHAFDCRRLTTHTYTFSTFFFCSALEPSLLSLSLISLWLCLSHHFFFFPCARIIVLLLLL